MRSIYYSTILALGLGIILSPSGCKKNNGKVTVYTGRLEVKAACMNYTISILANKVDTSLVVPMWTDESSKKSYKNVFRLGSPCTFPASINAGDTFKFVLDPNADRHCAVCLVFYPTPQKSLPIKVVTE